MTRKARSAANGDGTIYKHIDDKGTTTWYAQLSIGLKPDGTPKRKTFKAKTRAEVKRKMEDYKKTLHSGLDAAAAERLTLLQWLEFWYENYKKNDVKGNTDEWYQTQIYVHLLPSIPSTLKLQNVTPDHIITIINTLREKGLSDYNVYRLYIILDSAFKQAVHNRTLAWNPVAAIPKPKYKKNEKPPLKKDDLDKLLDVLDMEDRWGLATYLILATGLRIGELLALRWKDVDFANKRLTVSGTVTRLKGQGLSITDPKPGNAASEIPISDFAIQLLQYCKIMQQNMYNTNPDFINKHDTVFCTSIGTIISPENYRRAFAKQKEKAGIAINATPHTLRKTFATRLLERGTDLQTIKELLRHSHIDVTTEYYAFSNDEMQSTATNDLAANVLMKHPK